MKIVLYMAVGCIGGSIIGLGLGFGAAYVAGHLLAASAPGDASAGLAGMMAGIYIVPGGVFLGIMAGGARGFLLASRTES